MFLCKNLRLLVITHHLNPNPRVLLLRTCEWLWRDCKVQFAKETLCRHNRFPSFVCNCISCSKCCYCGYCIDLAHASLAVSYMDMEIGMKTEPWHWQRDWNKNLVLRGGLGGAEVAFVGFGNWGALQPQPKSAMMGSIWKKIGTCARALWHWWHITIFWVISVGYQSELKHWNKILLRVSCLT